MKQLGGTAGSKSSVLSDAAPLVQGASHVMFLSTYDASPATLLNQDQAVYTEGSDGKFRATTKDNAIAGDALTHLQAAGLPVAQD